MQRPAHTPRSSTSAPAPDAPGTEPTSHSGQPSASGIFKLSPYALLSDGARMWLRRMRRLTLVLLLFFGLVWSVSSWYLVQYIDQWRERLEQTLSQLWQRPVRIARLEADYDGLIPELHLRGLQVAADAPGAPPLLAIDHLQVNSNLYLLAQAQFSRILVSGLQLHITRLSQNQWQFGGYTVDMAAPTHMDRQKLLDTLFSQRHVHLDNVRLRWEDRYSAAPSVPPRAATVATFGPMQATMENRGRRHHFSIQGRLPPQLGAGLNLQAKFETPRGHPHRGDVLAWQGQLTVENEQLQLARLAEMLQPWVSLPVRMQSGSVEAFKAQIQYAGLAEHQQPSLANLLPRLHWQGSLQAQDVNLSSSDMRYRLQTPTRGLQLQMQFKDFSAQGQLQLRHSELTLGDVLVAKRIKLGSLSTPFSFELRNAKGEVLPTLAKIYLNGLLLSNDDLSLSARIAWQNTPVHNASAADASDRLGTLDLEGKVDRAKLHALVTYLPQVSGPDLLHYLQAALNKGDIKNGSVRIKGAVARIPAFEARDGQFAINAEVQNATFTYLPAYLTTKKHQDEQPWPALENMHAQFRLDGKKVEITSDTAHLLGYAQLPITGLKAQFDDIRNLQLKLGIDAAGQASAALRLLKETALADFMHNAVASMKASGPLALTMNLDLPIHTPKRVRLNGKVTLKGNSLHVNNDMPEVQQLVGTVLINEKGFHIPAARALVLGGPLSISGGMPAAQGLTDPATLVLKIEGLLQAAQLRAQTQLGLAAHAAHLLEGHTPFQLSFRLINGRSDMVVSSTLEGMQLNLPQPFKKESHVRMPLVFRLRPSTESDNAAGDTLDLVIAHPTNSAGKLLTLHYERTNDAHPRAVNGQIGVNLPADEAPPMLPDRVSASVNFDEVSVDDWLKVVYVLQRGANPPGASATPAHDKDITTPSMQETAHSASLKAADTVATDVNDDSANSGSGTDANTPAAALTAVDTNDSYLPRLMVLRAKALSISDRVLHQLTLAASREGKVWTVNGLADEFSGFAQYHQGDETTPAKVITRLERLHLGKSEVRQVDALIEKVETEPTTTLPDLDVEIGDLQIEKIKLGKVELLAENTLDTPAGSSSPNASPSTAANANAIEQAQTPSADSSAHADDPLSEILPTTPPPLSDPAQTASVNNAANSADTASQGAATQNAAALQTTPPTSDAGIALQDRTWELHKLNVIMPHAQANMQGSWQWLAADAAQGNSEKRLRMQFDVDTDDLGKTLDDLDLPDMINGGRGTVRGHVTWLGSPFAINYSALGGQLSVNVRNGQILKVDPGALKLLGIFSFQFLPRLLSFNLSSELQQGFTFDNIRGDVAIDQGVVRTDNLRLENGGLANVDIQGGIDLVKNEYDLKAHVRPQVNFGSATLAASALLGPSMLALLPAQWLVSKALSRGTEQYWQVKGPLNAPEVAQLTGPDGPPMATPALLNKEADQASPHVAPHDAANAAVKTPLNANDQATDTALPEAATTTLDTSAPAATSTGTHPQTPSRHEPVAPEKHQNP